MKKITFFIVAMLMASFSVFAVDMTGTYKVGTTIGADFTSLSAAINALNTATITGDVVFEITSDITEAANFGLGKDMGSFKLTIRPDADANRTITFTQAAANTGPWGHFVIGCATGNLGVAVSELTMQSTNNITIDGFAVGGNTKRLKFTTTGDALTNSILTDIVGGCQNIKIINCIYENNSIGSTSRCIYLFVVKNGAKDLAPSDILIDNNQIICFPSTSVNGVGIQCSGTGSPAARIANLDITNNYIKARSTGIEVYYSNGVEIYGNEIKVQKGTTTGSGIGVWLRGHAGDMYVARNKFTEVSSIQTGTSTYATQGILTGASSTNPFNVYIYNNTFSGMDRSVTGPAALNQSYIAEVGYGTTKIYHNTFYLPALTLPTQAGAYNAISFTTTSYKADIQNNIFISNEDAKSVFIAKAVTTGSMDNNIYYLRAGNTNARVVDTYATLSAFQTANPTLDIHSKSVDVNFVDAVAGNLKLTGASIGNVDLATLRLSSVLTDFSNVNRAAITYRGADEASDLTPIAREYTVNVPNGTSKVYVAGSFPGKDWDITTPYQLTPTSTANQFWGILPHYNGLAYKYLCEKGDWDYQEAAYNGSNPPVTGSNRSYSAIDNVPIWYRVNKLTFNVTFASNVPNTLFMKGSFDNWATGVPLSKNGSTFSVSTGGNPGDKYAANIEYKYYTNDDVADNWESDASGNSISNRWTVAPVMNDQVARFTTAITTGIDKALMQAGVQISKAGIFVPVTGKSNIELYSISGTLIDKAVVTGAYSRSLDNGIYIVKINGKAVKFVK